MSIIQEALKKAERQIKDFKQAPSADNSPRIKASEASGPAGAKKAPAAGSDPKAVAVLLVVLVVIAVFAAAQLFPKKNIPMRSSVADEAARSALRANRPAAVTSKGEELPALPSVIFQQPHSYTPEGAPSVQVPEEKKPTSPEFVLNGIMYLDGSPRAIVNDSMVEVGDMVGGARVVKIDKKNVLLEYDGAELNLDLK